MKWRTTTVISHVDIHIFERDEVVQRTGLVALRSYMQYVRPIDILCGVLSIHFFNHDLNQVDVTMVG